ncbi:MAG: bactofilin family protein [Bacteroidales bacterium]
MAKTNEMEATSNSINRICTGTTFVGNITASGDIRIDGVLEGNITTKGKLVVGETGKITGQIDTKNADVLGTINGKMNIEDLCVLRSVAKLKGDVNTTRILIEVGAVFIGNCNMSNDKTVPKS